MGLVNDDRVLAVGKVSDLLGDERKLLERGDDDGGTCFEGLGKLRRVLVNLLHDALLVVELVNRVLKLAVENETVGDDDDRIENLLVTVVVKGRKAVGNPCNGVALSAAR